MAKSSRPRTARAAKNRAPAVPPSDESATSAARDSQNTSASLESSGFDSAPLADSDSAVAGESGSAGLADSDGIHSAAETGRAVVGHSSRLESSEVGARPSGKRARFVCAFWIDGRCYGLEITSVGGVVTVGNVIPVPQAPTTILGLFNLRGAAMALVDLVAILDLPRGQAAGRDIRSALVLNCGSLLAAAPVDAVEAVFPLDRGRFRPSDRVVDHPAVGGFLDVEVRQGLTITVIDSHFLTERLDSLRFKRAAAGNG